jgi:hypothetical protein
VELLLAKGYNAKRLKARGIGISFLQDSLTPKELIGLGFTDKREFLDRNCGYQALKYRQSGLTAKDLVKLLGFTADELRSRYFGEREIKEAFEK